MSESLRLRGGQVRSAWATVRMAWFTTPAVLVIVVPLVAVAWARATHGTLAAWGLSLVFIGAATVYRSPVRTIVLRGWWANEWFMAARASGLVMVSEADIDRRHDNLRDDLRLARQKSRATNSGSLIVRWLGTSKAQAQLDAQAPVEVAPALVGIKIEPQRRVLTVRPLPGQVLDDFTDACEHLTLRWRAHEVTARKASKRGRIEIVVATREPFAARKAKRSKRQESSIEAAPTITIPGETLDGKPLTLSMGLNALVAGATRAGKSTFLRAVLLQLAPRPDVQLVLIDPKFVEFARWRHRPRFVAREPAEIEATLEILVAEMDARYQLMESLELDAWDLDLGPWIAVVADEIADLFEYRKPNESAELIERLARKSLACGIWLCAATQRPSANVISSGLRGNLAQRIAFRTDNQAADDFVFPGRDDTPCHKIPFEHPGRGYMLAADGRLVEFRVRHFPGETVSAADAENAHLCDITSGSVWPVVDPSKDFEPSPTRTSFTEPTTPATKPPSAPRSSRRTLILIDGGNASQTPTAAEHVCRPEVPREANRALARAAAAEGGGVAEPADVDLLTLIDRRGFTTPQLAEATGLSTATVKQLCADLVAQGTLERGGDHRWRRPA